VVPPILIILRESKLLDKYNLTTWKGMMSAAAPLGDDLAKSVEKRLPNCKIVQAYGESTWRPSWCAGLTETTPLITLMTTKDGDGRHGSIGKLLPTFEARLVDTESGEDVQEAGKAGELWVRGPSVMKGYYKNPEATEGTFAPDPKGRWFKTGDSATRDEGGFYRIADRLKELIKYKGFQGAYLRQSSISFIADFQSPPPSWRVCCSLILKSEIQQSSEYTGRN
jgi:acyl-CoA synthetase (AMP-forming)/AMP-acid ligase II